MRELVIHTAFEEKNRVNFVSNIFPERMDGDVVIVQIDGSLPLQVIPPMCYQHTISI